GERSLETQPATRAGALSGRARARAAQIDHSQHHRRAGAGRRHDEPERDFKSETKEPGRRAQTIGEADSLQRRLAQGERGAAYISLRERLLSSARRRSESARLRDVEESFRKLRGRSETARRSRDAPARAGRSASHRVRLRGRYDRPLLNGRIRADYWSWSALIVT